jgi:hypothetical protein
VGLFQSAVALAFTVEPGLVTAFRQEYAYVVVTFEVFGTRYYHYRDLRTSNLSSPEAQAYLKTVIRYDRHVQLSGSVSNDDIHILQTWGFMPGARANAADLACNLERQGYQVWSTSACISAPAQPSVPALPPSSVEPGTPVQPPEADQPFTPPTYPTQPSALAGRITRTPPAPRVHETVRFKAEASDRSDPYAPLSFNWFVDGQMIVQADGYTAYDAPSLDWVFDAAGSHAVTVTVTNRNTGASTQMKENVGITQTGGQFGEERKTTPEPVDSEFPLDTVITTAVGVIVVLMVAGILVAVLKSLFSGPANRYTRRV